MVFMDPLAQNLFLVGILFAAVAYYLTKVYLMRKNRDKEANNTSFGYFLIILGVLLGVYGLFYSLLWPTPMTGSYDILFGDSMVVLAFLAVLGGYNLLKSGELLSPYIGLAAFFGGIYNIIAGVSAYLLGMTDAPLMMLGLYLASGLAGVFLLPLVYTKNKSLVALIVILLIIAAIVSFVIGGMAVPEHLASFAHATGSS
ncbi:MAG: DUF981 family protein [Nanoarchaeota archaeon]|nr:DUF981 family protein [Nanoarchaeota archaeon]